MRFRISKNAQNFFSNIMNFDGSHSASDPGKFSTQFDVYYCCALIGMAAVQRDDDISDLKDMTEDYPKSYTDYKAQIAGLLVATEAKRLGIDFESSRLEEVMLQYLSSDDTMLSEDGVKALNAFSLKGYHLLHEYPLVEKPTSREEFLEAFGIAIKTYAVKDEEK